MQQITLSLRKQIAVIGRVLKEDCRINLPQMPDVEQWPSL